MNKKRQSFTVTLTDSVRYSIDVLATSEEDAKKQAIEIWHEDFLRFTPLNAGDIHNVKAYRESEAIMTKVAGGVL